MIQFQPGQGVCSSVGSPFYVPDVTSELGNKIQVVHLSGGLLSGAVGESKGKWLVVCGNVEMSAFNKMLKMLHCLVHCQELTVESAVVHLG